MMRHQTHQLNERTDNFIRAAEFRDPEWIPAQCGFLPEGGLMLQVEIAPDVPLANVEAICDFLEEFAGPGPN